MFETWLAEIVAAARVGHLGTIAADGRPNLVPVCFAYSAGHFVTAIDEKPKRGAKLARVQNLQRDRRVAFLIDHYDEDWRELAWLRVEGIAEVAPRADAFPEALAALRARYPQYKTMALDALPLILITPERLVAWKPAEGLTIRRRMSV